jgi:hypothetical protein
MGPGKGAVGAPEELLERPKMELKVVEVNELRRGRESGGESVGELFSLDMATVEFV